MCVWCTYMYMYVYVCVCVYMYVHLCVCMCSEFVMTREGTHTITIIYYQRNSRTRPALHFTSTQAYKYTQILDDHASKMINA